MEIAAALALALLAGWLVRRGARPGRRGGHQATLAFTPLPHPGLDGPGTPARIESAAGRWAVLLDRTPERGDLEDTDAWRGWVWLDAQGLPVRVRRDSGGSFRHWAVTRAIAL